MSDIDGVFGKASYGSSTASPDTHSVPGRGTSVLTDRFVSLTARGVNQASL